MPETIRFAWKDTAYQPVKVDGANRLIIGQQAIPEAIADDERIGFEPHFAPRPADQLRAALGAYRHSQSIAEPMTPPCAALLYDVTGSGMALSSCFPLLNALDADSQQVFFQLVGEIIKHPHFRVICWDDGRDISAAAPPSLKAIIAGHIAEVFFFRRDILMRLFESERRFNLYMNSAAYRAAGGIAGGCYDPKTESIKLVARRIFEGFFQPTPGVAPFLHEFGHMLDSFDAQSGKMRAGRGMLPGMRQEDGALFTPEARQQFDAGKRIEWERYEQCRIRGLCDQIPVGHPYVFRNDGEFIAGYLEMFFRNPHYFHTLNPTLYAGFALLLRQDPRLCWARDFSFYVESNRSFYRDPKNAIPPPGITRGR